jgi:hypothetical protein
MCCVPYVTYHANGPDEPAIEIDFTPPFKRFSMVADLEKLLDIKIPLPFESDECNVYLKAVCKAGLRAVCVWNSLRVKRFACGTVCPWNGLCMEQFVRGTVFTGLRLTECLLVCHTVPTASGWERTARRR